MKPAWRKPSLGFDMLPRAFALALALAPAVGAETIRIATYSPELTRDGPGLLLRDLQRPDKQIDAVVEVIAHADADILLLTGFDWDYHGEALSAFRDKLAEADAAYPYFHAGKPNSGMQTGLDLDGDGRLGTPDDAQGYGRFMGSRGMALLSRLPLGQVQDLTDSLWRDLPDNLMPETPPEVMEVQRLSSRAHWQIEVLTPRGPLELLMLSATTPVFDGPEDRNGRRNHDELAFWLKRLPDTPWVVMGKINLDPEIGEGRRQALEQLLEQVNDPQPAGAVAGTATAEWGTDQNGNPHRQRVDYVLPSAELPVSNAGVLWPEAGSLATAANTASRHYLVWVDIDTP